MDLQPGPAALDGIRSGNCGRAANAAAPEAEALFDLGLSCWTGTRGRPIDPIEAHAWFNLAATQGHPIAAAVRADLAATMTRIEIVAAQRRARGWLIAAGGGGETQSGWRG